ncbi:hypothetical protein ACV3OY_14745 [Clostridium perfringens]
MAKKITKKELAKELDMNYKTYMRREKTKKHGAYIQSVSPVLYDLITSNYHLGLRAKDIETLGKLKVDELKEIEKVVSNIEDVKNKITALKDILKYNQKTRVSVDVDNVTLSKLDDLCKRLGITRTKLVNNLLMVITYEDMSKHLDEVRKIEIFTSSLKKDL